MFACIHHRRAFCSASAYKEDKDDAYLLVLRSDCILSPPPLTASSRSLHPSHWNLVQLLPHASPLAHQYVSVITAICIATHQALITSDTSVDINVIAGVALIHVQIKIHCIVQVIPREPKSNTSRIYVGQPYSVTQEGRLIPCKVWPRAA